MPDETGIPSPDVTMAAAPSTAITAMSMTTMAVNPDIARIAEFRPLQRAHLNLSVLRSIAVADQVAVGPLLSSDPCTVEQAVAGVDGTSYYVPRARIAERSKATHAPYVFLERRAGKVYLQVWFELAIADPTAQPVPVDAFSVALVGAAGRVDFGRCDELPPTDKPAGVVSQLFCEAELDSERTNLVVSMLQTDATARFEVTGTAHYSIPSSQSGPYIFDSSVLSATIATRGTFMTRATADAVAAEQAAAASVQPLRRGRLRMASSGVLGRVRSRFGADAVEAVVTEALPTPGQTAQHTPMSLAAEDNAGVRAHFPPELQPNRPIYAQVTSGFGTEPWARWVPLRNGRFIESPVPEQFFVVPDEYRLAFDRETGMPAMMVLLVPPDRAPGGSGGEATGPTSFGGDYKIRCRFSVVPWYDPRRLAELREEIADHTGVSYPQLRGGGFRSATCALSKTYQSLGSSLVGTAEAQIAVDALGFDLVLDCTSEFYTLLSRLMITEGVGGDVVIDLVADAEQPERATVPIKLRLDRPALDVLTAELLAPPAPLVEFDEAAVESDPTDPAAAAAAGNPAAAAEGVGGATGEEAAVPVVEPAPLPPPRMRVSNPIPYPVTVAALDAKLLVVDDTLPTPIGAVAAMSNPATFTIPAGTPSAPATIELDLTPSDSELPPLYGGVGVSFVGVSVDIDPDVVLAKAHDLGASADLSSSVELRSYQLEHPDVLPASHADVFGIEVQLKRGEAEPITVFLTRDQPTTTVQVSFSLADVLAGSRPEQPKFSWCRRNLAGSGTGTFSDWETIVGRQLFVSPMGL